MDNSDSFKDYAQLQRKRRILITILCISCMFDIFWSIAQSINLFKDLTTSIVLTILFYSIFYGLNIYFAYRYCPLGLRIFAWLRIILVIILGLALILLTIGLITATAIVVETNVNNSLSTGTSLIYESFIVGNLSFILDIIAIVFHFKLARLIDGI